MENGNRCSLRPPSEIYHNHGAPVRRLWFLGVVSYDSVRSFGCQPSPIGQHRPPFRVDPSRGAECVIWECSYPWGFVVQIPFRARSKHPQATRDVVIDMGKLWYLLIFADTWDIIRFSRLFQLVIVPSTGHHLCLGLVIYPESSKIFAPDIIYSLW